MFHECLFDAGFNGGESCCNPVVYDTESTLQYFYFTVSYTTLCCYHDQEPARPNGEQAIQRHEFRESKHCELYMGW